MEMREIESLLQPDAYPEAVSSVSLIQTHISYLLLTDDHVYKIKKPVDLGFLDFSTIDRRRFYCNEEVRLNRRLSPDIYLEVVEVRKTDDGFAFTGNGPVADYAVKMVRMPEERMLHRLLAAGKVSEDDMRVIALKVAEFHLAADRGGDLTRYGSVDAISRIWEENLSLAAEFVGDTISFDDLALIRRWVESFMAGQAGLFTERMEQGFIRDCDGDLHLENICLGEKVWIFDCIEFSNRFRYIDTAADIAFLVMDLEFHDRPDLAGAFLDEYRVATGDNGCSPLVGFYKVYRAFVRGKVASIKLRDPAVSVRDREEARDRAISYFRFARGYILRQRLRPAMILVGGLMGSGKSTVSRLLGRELGVQVISSDRVRKELYRVAEDGGGRDPFGAGLYSREADLATYRELLSRSLDLLRNGESVIVDATFSRRSDRQLFRKAADDAGVGFIFSMTDCPETEIRHRLALREGVSGLVSDGRLDIFEPHRDRFEHPLTDEQFICLPTMGSLFSGVDAVLDALGVWE